MMNIRRLSVALAGTLILMVGAHASAHPVQSGTPIVSTGGARDPARAFIKLDVQPDRSGARGLYVGQAVPVTIHAYFLGGTGVSLNGLPRITSDAFVLSDLPDKPRQNAIQVRGLPYTSLTWTGVLTAVKAGQETVGIELPVSLTYREAPQPRHVARPDRADDDGGDDQASTDPFASILKQTPFANDPFFAQMFNGRDPFQGMLDDVGSVRQRDVTLRDQSGGLRVLDPPPGAPAGFTGAVGTFDVSAGLAGDTFRAGEPTTLKLSVRGRGSFSRLSVNGVAPSDDLSTYGVTSTFTPGPTPTEGEKVFAQTIAPRRAGTLTVPALTLTYLDPHERKYVTRHTAPIHITVAASSGDVNASPSTAASGAAASVGPSVTDPAAPSTVAPSTVATALPDRVRASLTPQFRTRCFRSLAAAIGLAALSLTFLGRSYRNGTLGRFATAKRVSREVARQRRAIEAAAASGDAATLFGAARKAFQARLGAAWGIPSEAIAAADVGRRLGPPGGRIQEVFEHADRLTYAGRPPAASEDLSYWQRLVSEELRALETTT
ncbi:MAG TPA: BatD family protein [Polyangia bacterium]|nr:BatD family protein [Polyangia bacterium]